MNKHKKKSLKTICLTAVICMMVSVVVMLAYSKTAYADTFDTQSEDSDLVLPSNLDVKNDTSGILGYFSQLITGPFLGILRNSADGCANQFISLYKFSHDQVKYMGYVLPNNLGSIGNTQIPFHDVYKIIKNVSLYLTPLGYTILALVYLVKTLSLLKEPNGGTANQTPYVEQIFWLWFQFAILKMVLDNSMALTGMLFNLVAQVCQTIATTSTLDGNSLSAIGKWHSNFLHDLDKWYAGKLVIGGKTCVAPGVSQLGMIFSVGIIAVVVQFATLLISVVTYAVVLGRWLQLFIYLQFAPVMFAFFGLDDTKSMSVSYMKSIFAMGIATLITLLLVMSLPGIFISMVREITLPRLIVEGFVCTLKAFAVGLIYVKAISSSGSWAKEIIGG